MRCWETVKGGEGGQLWDSRVCIKKCLLLYIGWGQQSRKPCVNGGGRGRLELEGAWLKYLAKTATWKLIKIPTGKTEV